MEGKQDYIVHDNSDDDVTMTGWSMPRRAARVLMFATGGDLSEGYGPGVCLGGGQTETYLKDMGMTDQASVWAMARRRPI